MKTKNKLPVKSDYFTVRRGLQLVIDICLAYEWKIYEERVDGVIRRVKEVQGVLDVGYVNWRRERLEIYGQRGVKEVEKGMEKGFGGIGV